MKTEKISCRKSRVDNVAFFFLGRYYILGTQKKGELSLPFLQSPDDIEASDKELVHGYFLAERLLREIEPDVTVLDDCEEFRDIWDAEAYCIEDEEWE